MSLTRKSHTIPCVNQGEWWTSLRKIPIRSDDPWTPCWSSHPFIKKEVSWLISPRINVSISMNECHPNDSWVGDVPFVYPLLTETPVTASCLKFVFSSMNERMETATIFYFVTNLMITKFDHWTEHCSKTSMYNYYTTSVPICLNFTHVIIICQYPMVQYWCCWIVILRLMYNLKETIWCNIFLFYNVKMNLVTAFTRYSIV